MELNFSRPSVEFSEWGGGGLLLGIILMGVLQVAEEGKGEEKTLKKEKAQEPRLSGELQVFSC